MHPYRCLSFKYASYSQHAQCGDVNPQRSLSLPTDMLIVLFFFFNKMKNTINIFFGRLATTALGHLIFLLFRDQVKGYVIEWRVTTVDFSSNPSESNKGASKESKS